MAKIKIGIIGCGTIANSAHIPSYMANPDVEIKYFCDILPEKAKAAVEKYGCGIAIEDYHDIIADPEVEAVSVCTPNKMHSIISVDCLRGGKHVLCEKPIAGSLEEGEAFVRAVKAAKQKCLVAHILRHNDSYRKIKTLIDGGVIGRPVLIRMAQNHHTMNWERYKKLLADCSPIIDCGVHYTDVAQWFTGQKITKVWGMGTTIEADAPTYNYGIMNFEMDGGCRGYYEAGWSKNTASCNLKEFIGTKGRISLTLGEMRSHDREEGDLIEIYHSETGVYETINNVSVYKNMYGQLMTLIDMIENDGDGDPTIDEVFSAFKAALTADKAIRENRILTVD